MKLIKRHLFIITILCTIMGAQVTCAYAQQSKKAKTTVKTPAKGKTKAPANKTKKKSAKKETSVQVKKKEQSVNKEIQNTKQQITVNETAVRDNLSLLGRIESDITAQNKKILSLQAQQSQLNADIAKCKEDIGHSRHDLQALRAQYVQAIKKMRSARRRTNSVAYVFSSKNFYQAWRRLRYLGKFKEWRGKREAEINVRLEQLAKQEAQLEAVEKQLSINLSAQDQAKRQLDAKRDQQDKVVAELRAQGDALRAHLAKKQAEANQLSAQVANLIEQEREQAKLEEMARRERAEKERAEKERREREARDKKAREEADRKAREEQAAREQKEKDKEKKQKEKQNKKETKPKGQSKPGATPIVPDKPKESTDKERSYADARKRRPRGDGRTSEPAQIKTATDNGFAAQKGTLPRPVSGQFNIVSHFGVHKLPDLPDVTFDNPGIDAVVSSGASAQAVYPGTVTSVTVLNNYSTVIILSHGDYYTVYGNIGTPSVTKGQKVTQGQNLGKLMSDPDQGGRTTIHFQVWRGREKLNPEAWIR